MDVLQSSRHVRVVFNGQELANTKRPRFLLETSLRRRTYIPKADCKMELLHESQLTTQCPYKVLPLARFAPAKDANDLPQGRCELLRRASPGRHDRGEQRVVVPEPECRVHRDQRAGGILRREV